MLRSAGIYFVLFIASSFSVSGQQLKPKGEFSKDTVQIGEPFFYSLSLEYPRELEVLFPDSLYNFAPFELSRFQAFQTQSDSLTSFDSTIYEFSTYEIDSTQLLQLPVFIVSGGDSITVLTNLDSVILAHAVTEIPDSITMISNTGYNAVNLEFNYPYLLIGLGILLVIGIVVLIFFGKSIKKQIQIYRLKRAHRRFLEDYKTRVRDLTSNGKNLSELEFLLWKWKDYMEVLNKLPFTKLTTKEIKEAYPDSELSKTLVDIDRVIYGRSTVDVIQNNFDFLRRVSEDSFHKKVEEIKNG